MSLIAVFDNGFATRRGISGKILFSDHFGGVMVHFDLQGLPPNAQLGCHIHTAAVADFGPDDCCSAARGHFNPNNTLHGEGAHRHAGDLCNNIRTDGSGSVRSRYLDRFVSLRPASPAYIGGRSVIIHAGRDDCGKQGLDGMRYTLMSAADLWRHSLQFKSRRELAAMEAESLVSGNAGKRIACANIVVARADVLSL